MNKLHTGAGLLLTGLLAIAGSQDPAAAPDKPSVVVGTFDSRAVVIAYIRSEAFQTYVTAQKADIDRARARAEAAGDARLVADLDALGPAMQRRVHEQGFGAAPADDVLARIADKLPALAAKAGVDVIVSQWKLAYRSPTARFVDVTDQLAAEFEPSEATWKAIRGVRDQDPVPPGQLPGHK